MKKIKVIQLVENLDVGGAEKVIAEISLGLDKKKFEVSVWCLSRGGAIAAQIQDKGATVEVLDLSSYYNLLAVFKLGLLFKKAQPDILHTHGYFASVFGRLAAKFADIPALFSHVHSTYWDYKKRHLVIEKQLSKQTDKIICCSEAVRDFVTGHEKIEPSKTIVIYNGVDETRFFNRKNKQLMRQSLGLEREGPVVGTVSSLTPHKGHENLIEAIPLVLSAFPKTKCLFIGDGVLKADLERKVERLNLSSSIVFLGIRSDIPEILNAMDIFVLPSSLREGLGISILEAMSTEIPVVATHVGGIPEVVDNGKTGILVPPKNPEALAEALIELLNKPDEALEMGRSGRNKVIETFTSHRMISAIEGVYSSFFSKGS